VEQNPRRFMTLKNDPSVKQAQAVARSVIAIVAGKVSDDRNADDMLVLKARKLMQ